MFFEATLGHSYYAQEGCTVQGGPTFCTAALPMSPVSNFKAAGFGDLPLLYPQAQIVVRLRVETPGRLPT